MLTIEYPSIFKKDYKRAIKRGCNPKNFEKVVQLLQNQQPLPKKYHDHALTDSRMNNPVSGNRLSGQQETASPDRGNRKNLITRADSYRVHKLLALKCPSVDQCL